MTYVLAIGDRSYSSWSLRGWLMFAHFRLLVEIRVARLYSPEVASLLTEFSPARTVPALRITDRGSSVVLWDTLAIAETLAERHPNLGFWPADPTARAMARSIAAEMHASFGPLRDACPMNLRRAYRGYEPAEEVLKDLSRIEALWSAARATSGAGGPWLFGAYSLADIFFAPVAARIATYGLPVGPDAAAYVALHLADTAFLDWRAEGLADPYVQAHYDLGLPERAWPGPTR